MGITIATDTPIIEKQLGLKNIGNVYLNEDTYIGNQIVISVAIHNDNTVDISTGAHWESRKFYDIKKIGDTTFSLNDKNHQEVATLEFHCIKVLTKNMFIQEIHDYVTENKLYLYKERPRLGQLSGKISKYKIYATGIILSHTYDPIDENGVSWHSSTYKEVLDEFIAGEFITFIEDHKLKIARRNELIDNVIIPISVIVTVLCIILY